jgi:hypothetical protein
MVLGDAAYTCDEPVLIPGYSIVVPLSDALQARSKIWFDEPTRCFPVRGLVIIEVARGRAVGRIDVPRGGDVGGKGTFDAEICPNLVTL